VTSEAKALSWLTITLMVFLSSKISPPNLDRDLAEEIALGDGRRHLGDIAGLGTP
jgi:hypothetical protein